MCSHETVTGGGRGGGAWGGDWLMLLLWLPGFGEQAGSDLTQDHQTQAQHSESQFSSMSNLEPNEVNVVLKEYLTH